MKCIIIFIVNKFYPTFLCISVQCFHYEAENETLRLYWVNCVLRTKEILLKKYISFNSFQVMNNLRK